MKDRINSAQIVVPCENFSESLEFFTKTLGFRVEMIYPADAPVAAVISGYGLVLRLEKSSESLPLTLRLSGEFGDLMAAEMFSPDGVRVIFADENSALEMPEIVPELVVSILENGEDWSEGRAGMLYRDLIPSRLGGRFVASHISIPVGGEVPDYVHFHKVRFQMIYCLKGWAQLVYEDQGEPFTMNAGDCVLQPPEIRHRVLETSDNFEVLEIGCPAIHETHADHALPLPNQLPEAEKIYGGQSFLHHIAANAKWKTSEIENLEMRETGIKTATNGIADVRVYRAVDDARFSVRHSDELLFFFVADGAATLEGAAEIYHLTAKSSFNVPPDAEFSVAVERGTHLIRVSLP